MAKPNVHTLLTAWRDHPMRVRLLALGLAALLVFLVSALARPQLRSVEDRLGDLHWRLGASSAPERRVVVVDIDEASLRQEGAWPWPRATLARLTERLDAAGAAVQVFDMVFPETKPDDEALAALWARSPVVLGQIFSLDPNVKPAVGQVSGAMAAPAASTVTGAATSGAASAASSPVCGPSTPLSFGFVGNAASLLTGRPATGHITPRMESDGVVRKVPALICHQGQEYPALALAALSRVAALPDSPAAAWQRRARQTAAVSLWAELMAPAAWLDSAGVPGVAVAVDERGDMRVPYRLHRDAMLSVSAADVLSGRVDAKLLNGSVVLIGATAFGLGDAKSTPLHAVAAGVEVHAQAIAGLLDNSVPHTPKAAFVIQVLGMALTAALLLAVATRRNAPAVKSLPLAGLAIAAAVLMASAWALLQANLWLPWCETALFALLGASALAAAEHGLTRAQRERLSAHLGAYLPAPVARRLAATDPTGSLEVVRRDISVMVTEIRNFAAYAAARPPEQTAAVLHAYCCAAVEVIERHGGIVENVAGDSIMAVWNAYGDASDHARRALHAGQDLLAATQDLFTPQSWLPEASAEQPLALGIGLESGAAIVGSFGPARRRAHTALGEPVTVAARLQSMTTDLSVPILVGPRMAASLPMAATVAQGEFLLEGLSRHCNLYAPAAWAQWVPPETIWPRGAPGQDEDAVSVMELESRDRAGLLGRPRAVGDA